MPTGKNWFNFVYVNLGFVIYIYGLTLLTSLKEIRKHWPLYRCNPMYMPLAPNIEENFVYCIQGMQSDFMGYILEPLTYVVSTIGSSIGSSLDDINMARGLMLKIRNFLSGNADLIYGIILNMAIEVQKITNAITDIVGKFVGMLFVAVNMLQGTLLTVESIWNGPPGQVIQAIGGSCFHPETKIKLKNGNIVCIKDINLGDILENGSRVHSTMKIDNRYDKEDLYIIKNNDVNGENIYVTGLHLVYDKKTDKFIKVKDYSKSIKSNLKTDYLNCLITSDHKISIGGEIFWDWEDHFIKK